MQGIIYKTTCLINGKIYIGQSKHNDDNYFGSGTLITLALRKYGKKNFTKEVLKSGIKTQKKLDVWEKVFIKKFDSTNLNIGYNILFGTSNKFGSGSPMLIKRVREKCSKSMKKFYETKKGDELRKKLSKRQKDRFKNQENRKKMSETIKALNQVGSKNHNYGNYWSEEQKQKSKKKMTGRYDGVDNPNFGNKWSEEQKEMVRERLKKSGANVGKNNPMFGRKRITNGVLNTTIEAGEELPKGFRFGMTRGLKKKK